MATLKRTSLAPDMPTVSETLPGFESVTWFGVYGPKGLPQDLAAKVNQAVNAALAEADVKDRFARLGAEPTGGSAGGLRGHGQGGYRQVEKNHRRAENHG